MNDELKGTPNPLNPSSGVTPLDANPSEPSQPINIAEPTTSAAPTFSATPMTSAAPTFSTIPMTSTASTAPTTSTAPIASAAPTTSTINQPGTMQSSANQFNTTSPGNSTIPMGVVESLDPTNRPMEHAPMPEAPQPKKNKKKTGLIIGGLACLFLAIGCGVAAVLLFMNHSDPVERAIGKLMSAEAPAIVTVQGAIDVKIDDPYSSVSDLKISINSDMVTDSLINSSTATLSGTFSSGKDFSLGLSEIYATNNDLFLRIDGISEIVRDLYQFSNSTETTGEDSIINESPTTVESQTDSEVPIDEEMMLDEGEYSTSIVTDETSSLFDVIDGEWIRIPLDELGTNYSELAPITDSETSCSVKLLTAINNNRNSIMEMYQRNSFISSTTKDLAVTSVKNPIYKVVFKGENFANFNNELAASSILKEYQSCTGETIGTSSIDSVNQALAEIPELYVEIDNNDNFTRLYFVTDISEKNATITTDLAFSYPTNVNISEPTEHIDLQEVLQRLLNPYYTTYDSSTDVDYTL